MESYVTSQTEHGITTIEFFHPKSNSLPSKMLEALAQEIHYAGTHDSKVVVLKSGGDKAFCAGASLEELQLIRNEKEGATFFLSFANVINAMRKCKKVIIGRIHGKCVGGGVGIAAAVDYAIALKSADVKLSELSLGISPFVIGPVIERKIGISAFSQLAIDASHWRNSDWAKKKGLFAEVHENIEDMDESIERLSNTLAHSSGEAMAAMKAIFWQGTDHYDVLLKERAAISGRLILSADAQKALHRIRQKVKS